MPASAKDPFVHSTLPTAESQTNFDAIKSTQATTRRNSIFVVSQEMSLQDTQGAAKVSPRKLRVSLVGTSKTEEKRSDP